ncbi:acetylserotonin O-methyltransferase [Streptomyces cucumeris]|uniref:acetylserotonin O-methyltransferase n=1 Tax=Streptomyces cucumeris TaxID=2962890 RepID=UPI0020C91B25|nr:acetylserotonin O-methyltransferase [Streptomyces sp. NEAU-Y11]MCP9212195.1 acetylserotonin O-methyltransferase [Streptomyces sp. NEAU-Y11]
MADHDMTEHEPKPDSPHALIDIAVAFWKSKVLLSAVELGVFAALAEEPGTLDDLRKRLGVEGRGAADFFDALVSMGVLEREDGVYRNSVLAARHLDPRRPATDISGYLEFLNAGFGWWARMADGLREGGRLDFSTALAAAGGEEDTRRGRGARLVEGDSGSDTFGEAFATPEQVRGFLRAMTGYSMGANQALAEAHDWGPVGTVADIGCAEGSLLVQLLDRHPQLRGIGFDLPSVGPGFTDHTRAAGVGDRAEFAGGDFFTEPMPTADVLVMGHVLHDWDLETKKTLIRKAHEALPAGGSLILYESLIDDDRRQRTTGLLISLNVSLVSAGGLGYTGAEARAWLTEAGFRDIAVTHLDGPEYMVVGVK